MLVRKLRQRIIDKSIHTQKSSEGPLIIDWKGIQHVLLILDSTGIPHSRIHKIREIIRQYDVQVDCLLYSDETQDNIKDTLQLTARDFKYKVMPGEPVLNQTIFKKQYDLVLCFNPNNHQLVQIVLLHTSGKIKLGCEPEATELYDITIVIDQDKDVAHFFQNAVSLLRNTSVS